MLRLNKKHLSDLLTHVLGITKVLSDAGYVPDAIPDEPESKKPAMEADFEALDGAFNPKGSDPSGAEPEARPSAYSIYGNDEDSIRRVKAMNRLCGKWTADGNNCDVAILRRGEHFIIHYLKDDGTPTGERYLLLWNDGEIYYYDRGGRIAEIALDTETDTLMFPPGADYTRIVETGK